MTDLDIALKRMANMRGAAVKMLYDNHLHQRPKFTLVQLRGALSGVGFDELYLDETQMLVEDLRDSGCISCTMRVNERSGEKTYENIALTARGRGIAEGRIVDAMVQL